MARRKQNFQIRATVRTIHDISKSRAFIAPQRNVKLRRADTPGWIVEELNRDGPFLVQHEGSSVPAVYDRSELIPEPAYWTLYYDSPVDGVRRFKEFAHYREIENFIEDLGVEDRCRVEGPVYSDRELREEGLVATRSLFDHLTDND
jgi:hypothetical protein